MRYSEERLSAIYERTDGCCHICGKRLAYRNRGRLGARGAWHVEHSRPKARGGTNHGNNLFAACITCNLEKSDGTTRAARARYGRTAAPLSAAKRAERQMRNTITGAIVGGVGAIALGAAPLGWIAAGLGALIGNDVEPDPQRWKRRR